MKGFQKPPTYSESCSFARRISTDIDAVCIMQYSACIKYKCIILQLKAYDRAIICQL